MPDFPRISPLGTDGLLVSFADKLGEGANRAALAFRAAAEGAGIDGLEETSTTLASTFLRFDPDRVRHAEVEEALEALLKTRDWYAAPLPENRKLWRIPTVFGTDLAPQLAEAAEAAGMSPEEAVRSISGTQVRVQTIGFAPGQPYLGELPPEWNIPRQSQLTDKVPVGAVVVAIRQLVLFSVTTPTGWRHIGQTAFRCFRPESDQPFALTPGDEVVFEPVERDSYDALCGKGPDGGATWELLE